MTVTIHQPDFLPWLGFFDRWQQSDVYILLDDAQFIRRGWHHRDKIKTKHGVKWLTVPVIKKGNYHQRIRDIKIDYTHSWRDKHLKTILYNYQHAPNFAYCFHKLQEIYAKTSTFLIDMNTELLHFIAHEFEITTPIVSASTYKLQSTSTQRLIELIESIGGTCYLTGMGAKGYLDESLFQKHNISVRWQVYTHPIYPQLHGAFIPMLSSLDYLMMKSDRMRIQI